MTFQGLNQLSGIHIPDSDRMIVASGYNVGTFWTEGYAPYCSGMLPIDVHHTHAAPFWNLMPRGRYSELAPLASREYGICVHDSVQKPGQKSGLVAPVEYLNS